MSTGTVKWFNTTKGFGFIQPHAGGADVFVHASAVERSNLPTIHEGQKLAYELERDPRNGKVSRFHWPTFPWTKSAYSCYKPGQWTTIAGAESVPVGNLFFAGEHCSYDFQGYMNGAAQSGADTAKLIMSKLSGSASVLRRLPRTA